ncbi:Hsp20/alpha crystallin family protein [Erysipelothrix sp. Poltava]|nr:Hsp20/alpha crystallin family protein [Erysipelothrix sp. Poltava]
MNNAGYGTGVDIYREEGSYFVEIEMPGFEKEDIDIEFSGDILSIQATRRESEEKDEKNYFYRSRNQKNIKRQIRFAEVDANAIDAKPTNKVYSKLHFQQKLKNTTPVRFVFSRKEEKSSFFDLLIFGEQCSPLNEGCYNLSGVDANDRIIKKY